MAAPSVVYKERLSSIPKYVVLTGGRGVPCRVAKRANRANQLVLFFLAGANFWEKHAKNCAIMSMAHITYAIAH